MYIKSVEVTGLWDRASIKTTFDKDINILIGDNGTGKTTLINLLKSALLAQVDVLEILPFHSLKITLRGEKQRTIYVNKNIDDNGQTAFHYQVGKQIYDIPVVPRRRSLSLYVQAHRWPVARSTSQKHQDLRLLLEELVNVSWLSVYRNPITQMDEEYARIESEAGSLVDQKLDQLCTEFALYHSKLTSQASELLTSFQQDVFKLLLYDDDIDRFDAGSVESIDLKHEEETLLIASELLRIKKDESSKLIKRHIAELQKRIKSVQYAIKHDEGIELNDVFTLPVVRRTREISRMADVFESRRKSIFERMTRFTGIINNFFMDKYFEFGQDKEIRIVFIEREGQISIGDLSSGEKQLLILLMETLIQDNQPCIYFADEPELSLHVKWQEQVLEAMKNLNDNAQLIVATHSPDIVSDFSDRIINMNKILKFDYESSE